MSKNDIKEVINSFRSKHKDILSSVGEDTVSKVVQWIPSGCAVLDGVLGGYNCRKGALASGRIYEIFSTEAKGKSTIAEHFEASVQNMGGVAVRINTEASHDPYRGAMVGVDEEQLIVVDTACLEDGWLSIEEYIRFIRTIVDKKKNLVYPLSKPILFTWDTITAASPRSELESGKAYAGGMMEKPRINRMSFRRLTIKMATNNATLLLLSQMSSGPGGTDAPGGRGIKHHTSVRVKITGGHYIFHGGHACGITSEVYVRKNKVSPTQHWKVPLIIDYETGINNPWTNFNFLVNSEVYIDTEYGLNSSKGCSICRGLKFVYEPGDKKKKNPIPCARCRYQPVTKSGAWYYINEYPESGKRINFYSKDFDDLILREGLKLGDYLDDCTYRVFTEMLGQSSRGS